MDFGKRQQFGVVISLEQRNVRVRMQSGQEIHTALGQCIPVTPTSNTMNKGRTDAEFNDFLSLKFGCDTMLNRFENNIKKLQESMTQIDGMGKPSKLSSLYMTVATVNAQSPDEVEEIRTKTLKVFQRFMDLVNGPLLVTFNGIGFGDHQVVWLDQVLG